MFNTIKKFQIKAIAVLASCALLAGCIPVKDISGAWEAAESDTKLRGFWVDVNSDDSTIVFETTDGGYMITSGSSGLEGAVRSLTVGEHTYLVVVSLRPAMEGFEVVDDKSGNLLLYELDGDTLHVSQMDSAYLEDAINNGDVEGTVSDEEATTVTRIDDDTLDWLEAVAEDEDAWQTTTYTRE